MTVVYGGGAACPQVEGPGPMTNLSSPPQASSACLTHARSRETPFKAADCI